MVRPAAAVDAVPQPPAVEDDAACQARPRVEARRGIDLCPQEHRPHVLVALHPGGSDQVRAVLGGPQHAAAVVGQPVEDRRRVEGHGQVAPRLAVPPRQLARLVLAEEPDVALAVAQGVAGGQLDGLPQIEVGRGRPGRLVGQEDMEPPAARCIDAPVRTLGQAAAARAEAVPPVEHPQCPVLEARDARVRQVEPQRAIRRAEDRAPVAARPRRVPLDALRACQTLDPPVGPEPMQAPRTALRLVGADDGGAVAQAEHVPHGPRRKCHARGGREGRAQRRQLVDRHAGVAGRCREQPVGAQKRPDGASLRHEADGHDTVLAPLAVVAVEIALAEEVHRAALLGDDAAALAEGCIAPLPLRARQHGEEAGTPVEDRTRPRDVERGGGTPGLLLEVRDVLRALSGQAVEPDLALAATASRQVERAVAAAVEAREVVRRRRQPACPWRGEALAVPAVDPAAGHDPQRPVGVRGEVVDVAGRAARQRHGLPAAERRGGCRGPRQDGEEQGDRGASVLGAHGHRTGRPGQSSGGCQGIVL